jgi:hypothetical protein
MAPDALGQRINTDLAATSVLALHDPFDELTPITEASSGGRFLAQRLVKVLLHQAADYLVLFNEESQTHTVARLVHHPCSLAEEVQLAEGALPRARYSLDDVASMELPPSAVPAHGAFLVTTLTHGPCLAVVQRNAQQLQLLVPRAATAGAAWIRLCVLPALDAVPIACLDLGPCMLPALLVLSPDHQLALYSGPAQLGLVACQLPSGVCPACLATHFALSPPQGWACARVQRERTHSRRLQSKTPQAVASP